MPEAADRAVPVRMQAVLLLLLLLLCGIAAGCSPATRFRTIPLSGSLHILECDNAACPYLPAQDPRWREAALGPDGLARPLPHREGVAWVRFTFDVRPQDMPAAPAFLFTRPPDAEEIFLNGVFIEGEGRIADGYVTAPDAPRWSAVPPGLLRPGPNVLTMKVLFAAKNVHVFDGPIRLGERDRILAEAERLRRPIVITESSFLTMFSLFIAFYVLLVARGVVRSDYLLFIAFLAAYSAHFLLDSYLLHLIVETGPGMERARPFLSMISVMAMLALVTSATGSRFGIAAILLFSVAAGFMVMYALMPPLSALRLLTAPMKAYLAVLGVHYLVLSTRAVLRGRDDSWPILAGVTVYVVGSRVELFWGLNMRDYAMGGFALCMLFALLSRHARLRNRLVEVSAKLLDAHEQERGRIARDIHDSVGQSLLALRLRMQMLAARTKAGDSLPAEALEGLAQDASDVIEEVRRASMDLRPSFVESMSLQEAINWYAGAFTERNGMRARVHVGNDVPANLPSRVKDNLCRAFQEILTNAAKHSGADRVEVSVYRTGGNLVLQVSDNGSGLDPARGRPAGIGLATIRERAELLGGSCFLESHPGRGTTVKLEVPLS